MRAVLRSVWEERRPPDPPVRVWRDWALVGLLAPTAVLGRTYPLVDTAEALRHVEQGHARGKIIVTVP